MGFVGHFGAVFYPVSEVEVVIVHRASEFDLVEDGEGAGTAACLGWVLKRIDRRQAITDMIENGD